MQADELAKLVNRSGFLFQIAVEEHVRQGSPQHGWDVIAREYPWSTSDGNRSGFVDFIGARSTLRCVVECKRTQGGEWIFLVPADSRETKELRTLWSFVGTNNKKGQGWDDLHFEPATYSSEFCIVRGGSDDDKPMLERIASDLVRAAESLAREELRMQRTTAGPTAYIPLIVTNANLLICRVAPRDVELLTGSVPSTAVFEMTKAIRFRKSLASDLVHAPESYSSFKEGAERKERSAFVVHVSYLNDFLDALSETRSRLDLPPYPWAALEL